MEINWGLGSSTNATSNIKEIRAEFEKLQIKNLKNNKKFKGYCMFVSNLNEKKCIPLRAFM
jgi:hypothetical protein